jgi:hypothetical protein
MCLYAAIPLLELASWIVLLENIGTSSTGGNCPKSPSMMMDSNFQEIPASTLYLLLPASSSI